MDVRLIKQLIGPSGKIFPYGPGPIEGVAGWYKEWRLEVTIENQRYNACYRGSFADPKTHDLEFEEWLKKDLARRIGRLINDQILDKL